MITYLENFHTGCSCCARRVLVTGCFDLVHLGHLNLIQRAKQWGRELIVGINSDASVAALKPGRPINREMDRAMFLKMIKGVDHVVIFGDPTCTMLIHKVQPMVWVKGGDYTLETLNQEEVAAARCYGRVEIVPLTPGFSTTKIIERMKQ